MRHARSVPAMHEAAERALVDAGIAVPGDRVVLVSGELAVSGATNAVRVRAIR